jgi:voltage-gated potassium channel
LTDAPEGTTKFVRYLNAFYWTITTLTTIGYGDITPDTPGQTFYVILIEILGAGMYGLVIGNIANLIANIDVAKTQYKEKLDKINTFLKYRNIPFNLQRKINDYYNYLWESRRGYDESSVLADLPGPLKESVSLFLNKEIIEKVPIFEAASTDLIKDVVMNMEPVVFTPGDYIVRAGEVGYDMFFISRGRVDVMSADEQTSYAILSAGQFFGEIALLLSMPRTATIKATEYCDLYRLDKETFDRILTRYPDFLENIQALAEQRRAEIDARAEAAKDSKKQKK